MPASRPRFSHTRRIACGAKAPPSRPPSGRAVLHRKVRVDEVHRLDLADLRRAGALRPGRTGTVWISRARLGRAGAPSEVLYGRLYDNSLPDESPGARLLVAHGPGHGRREPALYEVELTSTPCPFGGRRWWFRCPLVINGVPCGRRCRVLYKPLGAPYFGCRLCFGLTYAVRQLHRDLGFEGWTRALQLADEIRRNPWPRSARKRTRRLERLIRINRALKKFQARVRGRSAA